MASISKQPNGRKTVQFVAHNGKRKSIRLGKVSLRMAESVKLLEKIMIESNVPGIDEEALYEAMKRHRDFESAHFWRFNLNRLRHLIERYRLTDPNFRR